MSTDSFAALRKSPTSSDLQKLADHHLQHDLEPSDRAALKSAASAISTYATIGSLVGLGLGLALAWRTRSNRVKMFEAFRAAKRPTHVKFADGTEEAIPDITPLLKPTPLGDGAAYAFFGIAGLFLGGETGLLTGVWSAKGTITGDPARRERLEKAMKAYRIDVLKQQLQVLEKDGGGGEGEAGSAWGWNM